MIEIIKNSQIQAALENNHRQYLVGDLKLPQQLEHIRDGEVEMGITAYECFKVETPHFHPVVTEYQTMLSGTAKYVDLAQGKEYLVEAGDVFVIRPDTPYLQKSPKGAVILFFKHPGGNDKTPVPMTEQMERWAADWDAAWEG